MNLQPAWQASYHSGQPAASALPVLWWHAIKSPAGQGPRPACTSKGRKRVIVGCPATCTTNNGAIPPARGAWVKRASTAKPKSEACGSPDRRDGEADRPHSLGSVYPPSAQAPPAFILSGRTLLTLRKDPPKKHSSHDAHDDARLIRMPPRHCWVSATQPHAHQAACERTREYNPVHGPLPFRPPAVPALCWLPKIQGLRNYATRPIRRTYPDQPRFTVVPVVKRVIHVPGFAKPLADRPGGHSQP
jgi:hypothetical protein